MKRLLGIMLLVFLCGCLPTDSPVVVKNEEIVFEEPVILDEDSATVQEINISKIAFVHGPYMTGGVNVDRGKIVVTLMGIGKLSMAQYVASHGGNFSNTIVAEIYDNGIRFNNAFITAFGSSIYQTTVTLMVNTAPYNAFMSDFEAWNTQNGLFELKPGPSESTLPGGRVYQQKVYQRK